MIESNCINCTKILGEGDGKCIEGTLLEILEILFENSDIQSRIGCKLCESCDNKVKVAFEFKGLCICTEDKLYPYVCGFSKHNDKIDLNVICNKESAGKSTTGYPCRLCLTPVDKRDRQLLIEYLNKRNIQGTFKLYLQEVNLGISEDPIICESCRRLLDQFMLFREFINNIPFAPPNNNCLVDISIDKDRCSDFSNETVDEIPVRRYKCKLCSRKFKSAGNIKNHLRSHKKKCYKCKVCTYTSKLERFVKIHEKKHNDGCKMKIKLKTGCKKRIRNDKHMLYYCNECPYTSTYKHNLQRHMQIHQGVRGNRYRCYQCEYTTNFKCNLQRHTQCCQTVRK